MDNRRSRKAGATSAPDILFLKSRKLSEPESFQQRLRGSVRFKLGNVLKSTNLKENQQSKSADSLLDVFQQSSLLLPLVHSVPPTLRTKDRDLEIKSSFANYNSEASKKQNVKTLPRNFKISLFPSVKNWLEHTSADIDTCPTSWQKSRTPDVVRHVLSSKAKRSSKEENQFNSSINIEQKVYDQMLQFIRIDNCKHLRSLLKKRLVDVNIVLEGQGSLLHNAAYKGCCKCIKYLLKAGSYVNLSDELGYAPLHAAVLGKSYAAVRLLLDNNALPDQLNIDGLSPCHLCVLADDIYLIHDLVMANSDPLKGGADSPFQMAIDLNKNDALAYFLSLPSLMTKGC